MKKVLSLVLVAVVVATLFALAACGNKVTDGNATTLKLGLGVASSYGTAKDADGDTDGSAKVTTNAVAVLLDAEGKIVDIAVDTLDATAAWTSAGVAAASTEAKTKRELGTDYGMSAYGKKHDGSEGKVLEWFEQADIFEETVKGKTLDEVKAFMGEDTYAIGDLAAAGCTVHIDGFIKALEKAVATAADSKATADDKLNLAFATTISNTDATEEKDGSVGVDATIVAAAVNAEGKVAAAKTDALSAKVTFDTKGAATYDAAAAISTKLELGDNYNMAAYGTKHDGSEGAVLEWYAQAAAFDAALEGKTAAEFSALADAEGYGTGDLAAAGCTIGISDMLKAATVAATVA